MAGQETTSYVSNSFSIDNSKMIEVRNYGNDTNESSSETIWVSTRSDSDYIEKIKGKNKKVLKVITQTELDSIAEMNYEKNQIMMEENDFEELGNYFRYNANIKESPKNAVDYNHNGMVRFFKLNDKSSAILETWANSFFSEPPTIYKDICAQLISQARHSAT